MAATVKHLQEETKKKLDKLHSRCKEKAKSKKVLDQSFIVEADHIVKRGQQQNSSLRSSILVINQ